MKRRSDKLDWAIRILFKECIEYRSVIECLTLISKLVYPNDEATEKTETIEECLLFFNDIF